MRVPRATETGLFFLNINLAEPDEYTILQEPREGVVNE